jgi:hypothetical protein
MDQALDEAERDIQREIEERQRREAARRAHLVASARFTTKTISPFDVFELKPARERGWDSGKQLSEKQRACLIKQGIDPGKVGFAQGKQLLGEIFKRWSNDQCSFRQAKILKTRGYSIDVSRDEAKKIIDEISLRERWTRRSA